MQGSPSEATGCTVGVIHTPGGMLFFKNRDLQGTYLQNRITIVQSTPECHALRGVNLKTGVPEGVSIGVNRHRVCVANTHVVSTADVTYDVLCERLLNEARERADVPAIVEGFMQHNAVQGGRILVSSPGWGYLVEVLRETFSIQEIASNSVITNSFSLISHEGAASDTRQQSSASRLAVASRLTAQITRVGELKSMLRSHEPEKGELSICNHRQDGGGTESSHIIQIQGAYTSWSSCIGFPCENDYHAVQLFAD